MASEQHEAVLEEKGTSRPLCGPSPARCRTCPPSECLPMSRRSPSYVSGLRLLKKENYVTAFSFSLFVFASFFAPRSSPPPNSC